MAAEDPEVVVGREELEPRRGDNLFEGGQTVRSDRPPGRAAGQAGDNLLGDLGHHVHVVHVLRLLVGVAGVLGIDVVPVALVDAGVERRHRARLRAAEASTL